MNLKRQLQLCLKKANISAADLSRRSGVPKQTISDWLGGVPPRSIPYLKQIADVFDMTVDDLLFGNEVVKGLTLVPDASLHFDKPSDAPRDSAEEIQHLDFGFTLATNLFAKNIGQDFAFALGWTRAQISSRPLIEFIHADDRYRANLKFLIHFRSGGHIAHYDIRMLTKEGAVRWMRWNALMNPVDGCLHFYGKDVTSDYPPEVIEPKCVPAFEIIENTLNVFRLSPFARNLEVFVDPQAREYFVRTQVPLLSTVILTLLNQIAMDRGGDGKKIVRIMTEMFDDGLNLYFEYGQTVQSDVAAEAPMRDGILDHLSGFPICKVEHDKERARFLIRIQEPCNCLAKRSGQRR